MRDRRRFHHTRAYGFGILFIAMTLAILSFGEARSQQAVPIHVVRVGYGDVEGLRNSAQISVDACRALKQLPPGPPKLPSDDYLAKFEVINEEEFFDGQMWAKYGTQRQVAADGASGCSLAVFVQRSVEVQRICESRMVGGTALLAELMDVESPSSTAPEVSEEAMHPSACREKPRPYDLTGLPRESAGAEQCVWNNQILAKKMAAIGMKADSEGPGFDMCLYEALPMYYFQGVGHPVILKTRTIEDAAGKLVNSITGATKAAGNLQLKSFTTGVAIDRTKFGRPEVDAFLNLPVKTPL